MMLRICRLQQWQAPSDRITEESLNVSHVMRRFAGLKPGDDRLSDKTSILESFHVLERDASSEAMFAEANVRPR
ncbi:MAG: transposase [Rhodobacterales bacterium]|nr:transposase [Rhodobacterales bacterium]